MSNQPPAGPPEGWEPRPQGEGPERPTEPQWEGSQRPTEPQWPTQGPQWGHSHRRHSLNLGSLDHRSRYRHNRHNRSRMMSAELGLPSRLTSTCGMAGKSSPEPKSRELANRQAD
jgi:hypothetical protein